MSPEYNIIISLFSNRSYMEKLAHQLSFINMLRRADEVAIAH